MFECVNLEFQRYCLIISYVVFHTLIIDYFLYIPYYKTILHNFFVTSKENA
jgi:hypothetical protein